MDAKSTSEIQVIADKAAEATCTRQAELCAARMALVQQQVDNIEDKVEKQTKAIDGLGKEVRSFKADLTKQMNAIVVEVAGLKQRWTIWPTLGAILGALGAIAGLVTFIIAVARP